MHPISPHFSSFFFAVLASISTHVIYYTFHLRGLCVRFIWYIWLLQHIFHSIYGIFCIVYYTEREDILIKQLNEYRDNNVVLLFVVRVLTCETIIMSDNKIILSFLWLIMYNYVFFFIKNYKNFIFTCTTQHSTCFINSYNFQIFSIFLNKINKKFETRSF